jgi:hypothetical protein
VADVLVVVGLAGQKLAVMRAEGAQQRRGVGVDSSSSSSSTSQAAPPTPSPVLRSAAVVAPAVPSAPTSSCSRLAGPSTSATTPLANSNSSASDTPATGAPSTLDSTREASAGGLPAPPHRQERVRVRGRRRAAVRRRCGSMLGRIVLNWRWILAICIFVSGQMVELVALGFASQTQVVAMGNFGLPWNAVISVLVFKEEFAVFPRHRGWKFLWQWDLFAMATLILGATMVVLFAPLSPNDSDFDADMLLEMWVEFPYAGFGIGAVVVAVACGASAWRNWNSEAEVGNWNCVMLACICALLSSFTVTMSKVTTILIKEAAARESNPYTRAGPLLMTLSWVVMLVSSMCLINVSLGRYEQGLFFPIYEVLSSTLTIVSGILYYKTYDKFVDTDAVGFVFGVIIMVLGIWLTSAREHKNVEELERNLDKQLRTFDNLLAQANAGAGRGGRQGHRRRHRRRGSEGQHRSRRRHSHQRHQRRRASANAAGGVGAGEVANNLTTPLLLAAVEHDVRVHASEEEEEGGGEVDCGNNAINASHVNVSVNVYASASASDGDVDSGGSAAALC